MYKQFNLIDMKKLSLVILLLMTTRLCFAQDNITFVDANVKALCVANWDTNGDGELSYAEAATVTSLGEVFKNNNTITSFSELQYFTGLSSIGGSSFSGCSSLTTITIPNSVTSIEAFAFNSCTGLTSVYYAGDIAQWCGIGFTGNTSNPCSFAHNLYINNQLITELIIPNSVTSINNCAFYGCSALTSVTIGDSVTSIGVSAFAVCSGLTSVTIGNSLTLIGAYAFSGCSGITSVTLGNSVTTIDESAFNSCTSLTSIVIPNSVISIGNSAFLGNGLTSLTIGNSVTTIGRYAFDYCSALTLIESLAETPPTLDSYAFSNVPKTIPVYVPCGSLSAYQSATGWSEFTNFVGIDTEVEFWETVCDTYTWHGTPYAESGTYTWHGTIEGCDVTETLHLTINAVLQADWYAEACNSYTWNGETYFDSGDYEQILTTAQGCDSIVTLHLTINEAIYHDWYAEACNIYTWNGTPYTASGNYTQNFTSVQGCDSIVTLHLTISDIETESFNVTECDTYPWHGTTYTESGVYTFETITPEGCQRIETLYLTINPSETEDFTMTAVESYTWHGTTYTESGDYTYETTTAQGCPRIETLHLTITHGQEFYTIIASAGPNGRIQPEGEVHVEPGGMISFTITPDPGCAISQVIIDGVEYAPIETVAFSNVHGDHTLQALFWGVGVEENEMPVVRISPNPAQKEALVECEGMRRVELYSLSGVKVFDKETQNDNERMALDGLSSGMYVVKVVLDGGYCQYAKLIVSE